MKLIIIIPAYNEGGTITEVIKNIPQSIEGVDSIEILVVDDGSIDQTVAKVKSETVAKIVSHGRNRGVGAAFRTGVEYALENRADILINIDADGQFDPLDIPKLVSPILNNEADFVTASRFVSKEFIPDMPKIKLWGNKKMAKLISWLTRNKFYDVSCGFRAFNKEALLNLNLFGQFTYTQETFLELSFKGLRIREIPVKVKYFPRRCSKVYQGVFHYAISALKIIFRTLRDYRPLKFFGSIGLFIFFLGVIFDTFMITFFIQTGAFTPHKWIGLTGIVLNIIGLIILILALVIDMFYRIRINQERILYYQKKRHYHNR